MQKLLDQPQRTDPAAYRSAQNHSEQSQDSQHIPRCSMSGCIQRVLQRT